MLTDHQAVEEAVSRAIQESPNDRIPFAEFMELALCHQPGGYYAALPDQTRTGRGGDFYTSVSVGRCFGMLLAGEVAAIRARLGAPESVAVVDCGGHDGQLADDIASSCPFPVETTLVEQGGNGTALEDLASAPVSGLMVANELVDALPVHRIRFRDGRWHELYVDADRQLVEGPLSDPRLDRLGGGFRDGYTTEINLRMESWIADASAALKEGTLLVIDYGYEADEFYAPHRTEGTLRTYYQHRAGDDPLAHPAGSCDITAHVDFTALRDAAEAAGFVASPVVDQHHFLIRLATPWLQSLEADPDAFREAAPLLRQFKTLTHPGIMGRSFRILQLDKPPAP